MNLNVVHWKKSVTCIFMISSDVVVYDKEKNRRRERYDIRLYIKKKKKKFGAISANDLNS
jgi:hypothetical protein